MSSRDGALHRNCHAGYRTLYGSQRNSLIPIVNQGPLRRALIAQPVMFYLALLLPSTNKWRSRRLTRLRKAIGFYQEELTFPQSEKRFVASYVGTMAKHGNNCFLLLSVVEERSK